MAIAIHKLGDSVCRLRSLDGIGVLSVTDDFIFEPKDDSAILLIINAAKSNFYLRGCLKSFKE